MAITPRFSVMCDEVRLENNGKYMIIGMYTPDMAVPQLPYLCPVLTFVFWIDCTIPGNYQFHARLIHLESGNIVTEAMGGMGVARPGPGVLPVRLVGVPFTYAGPYTFTIQFPNEAEILHQFAVVLSVPAMPGQLGLPQAGR